MRKWFGCRAEVVSFNAKIAFLKTNQMDNSKLFNRCQISNNNNSKILGLKWSNFRFSSFQHHWNWQGQIQDKDSIQHSFHDCRLCCRVFLCKIWQSQIRKGWNPWECEFGSEKSMEGGKRERIAIDNNDTCRNIPYPYYTSFFTGKIQGLILALLP